MKISKIVAAVIVLLSVNVAGTAQEENILLERSFWKGNPNLQTVQQKISEGANATALNANAFDAVVYALIEKAEDDVVKHLLSLPGNPVNKKTHDSRIYLHWAAYAGQTNVVKHLLEQGSSATALDSHGYTPLAFAANAGQKNSAIYEAFEKYGVNLTEEKTEQGANLMLLVAPALSNKEELNYFINKGFDVSSTDNDGNGIFNYAVKKGNIDFLKLLVAEGVDYKTVNKQNGNAFLFATQGGRGYSNPLAVYEYLKSLGLEPNVVTKQGYTPLHRLAFGTTDTAIFNFFINAGADVNQKDADGATPFLNAASRNKLEIVQLLSKHTKNFNEANNNGQTALMLAVQRNTPNVVSFLLKKGGNAQIEDAQGNSIASYLVTSFNEKNPAAFDAKLALLQQQGVNLSKTQSEGNNLYHLAAKINSLELFKRLATFKIDINAKNDEGLTPLHLAAMKADDDKVMRYLISQGADASITTDFEETVYDLATENEQLQKKKTSLNFLK